MRQGGTSLLWHFTHEIINHVNDKLPTCNCKKWDALDTNDETNVKRESASYVIANMLSLKLRTQDLICKHHALS